MSKYGYLEVFHRVPWISYNESRLYFFIYKSLRWFLPNFRSISLSIQEKKRKIYFQYACHGGHLDFPIGTVFFFFFFLSTIFAPMLLLSFDSIGLSVQEKKRKNRFSRWPPCWPAWISIGTIFASLNLQVNPTPSRRAPNPQIFLPRFESVGLSVQEKKRKIDFQDDRPQISNRNDFSFFFLSTSQQYLS